MSDAFHPHQEQLLAITSLLGALIGTLRATGVLAPEQVEDMFQAADAFLPDRADHMGVRLLATVRSVQKGISSGPAPD